MSGIDKAKKRKVGENILSRAFGGDVGVTEKPPKHFRPEVGNVKPLKEIKDPADISWLDDATLLKVYKNHLISGKLSSFAFDLDQIMKLFKISSKSEVISGTQTLRRVDLEQGRSAVLWAQVCDDYSGQYCSKKLYVGVTSRLIC